MSLYFSHNVFTRNVPQIYWILCHFCAFSSCLGIYAMTYLSSISFVLIFYLLSCGLYIDLSLHNTRLLHAQLCYMYAYIHHL
jgi:hypothetical protein